MTDLDRMLIQHACAELQMRFHLYVDSFQHEKILELFTTDAVWLHKFAGDLRGLAAIRRYLDSKRTDILTQHVNTNQVIDVIDANRARGVCYYTYYHAEPGVALPAPLGGPAAVGLYQDEFTRTREGWRFSFRNPRNQFEAVAVSGLSIAKPGARWGDGPADA